MKRNKHIVVILVLASLAGCSRVETDRAPARRISYEVGACAPVTKAPVSLYPGIDHFTSKAWLYASGVATAQEYFGSDGVRVNYGSGEWAPAEDYFWPADGYINFVSWYDKNGTPSTATQTTLAWNLDGTSRSLAPGDTILFADEAWRCTANQSTYQVDPGETSSHVTNGVPTLFHHALAQVRFLARLSQDSASGVSWSASLSRLSVSNVYKTGTLSLSNEDPGSGCINYPKPWTNTSWSLSGAADTLYHANSVALSASDTPVMAFRSVLPQATAGMTLTFNCTITTSYTSSGKTVTENLSASIPMTDFSGDITSWDMGTKVTYTIVIDPETNLIRITPGVADWTPSSPILYMN